MTDVTAPERPAVPAPSDDPAYELLAVIVDGRCPCGGSYKWTGVQIRCERCDGHEGYGYSPRLQKKAAEILAARGVPS